MRNNLHLLDRHIFQVCVAQGVCDSGYDFSRLMERSLGYWSSLQAGHRSISGSSLFKLAKNLETRGSAATRRSRAALAQFIRDRALERL